MKSLGNFPDAFAAEIAGQPDALRRASAALEEQRAILDRLSEDRPEAIVFTGMGSSYDACYPAVNELAGRGRLALHLDTAELLHFRARTLARGSVVVIVSQSGRSAEARRLAAELHARARPPIVVTLTNGLDNPLARGADLPLDTRAGHEEGPSTKTFAASLVQVGTLALVLSGGSVDAAIERTSAGSATAADAIDAVLDRADDLGGRLAEVIGRREVVAILGRGPARAAAEMGALTLKECGVMAEAFEGAAFRHGSFELAGPSLGAVVLATEPETRELDLAMAAEAAAAGASVAVLGPDVERVPGTVPILVPALDRLFAAAVSIVSIQLAAHRLARDLGREPGVYLRASKVTTRE